MRSEVVMDRFRATRLRYRTDAEDSDMQIALVFAAGVLLGGEFPDAAAAVEVAFRRLWPEAEFPGIV